MRKKTYKNVNSAVDFKGLNFTRLNAKMMLSYYSFMGLPANYYDCDHYNVTAVFPMTTEGGSKK